MSATDSWPSYPTGDKDSIFAIGVISLKFVELEAVLIRLFATILRIPYETAQQISSRVGSSACSALTDQAAEKKRHGWSEDVQAHIEHFLKGFSVCTENRNNVAHSDIAWSSSNAEVALYKISKNGNEIMAVAELGHLHRVADDMNTYAVYGRQLANAINNHASETPIFDVGSLSWPDKPLPPHTLDYKVIDRPQPSERQA